MGINKKGQPLSKQYTEKLPFCLILRLKRELLRQFRLPYFIYGVLL